MSPTNSRSSSISSASTSSSKCSDSSIKKKFACSHAGCGKSFSRSEHLHRHALNHKDGNNTCLRCSAHFRRRDLLDRHMARHKEKDDEAGGEGLGVLATRKRLWRDSDGNIVNARRPSYTQEGPKRRQLSQADRKKSTSSECSSSSEASYRLMSARSSITSLSPSLPMSRTGSTSSTIVVDTARLQRYPSPTACEKVPTTSSESKDGWLNMTSLPTPAPTSQSSTSPPSETDELETLYEDTWPIIHDNLPSILPSTTSPDLVRSSEYPASPTWGPQPFQTFMGAMAELPYDDIFKPENGLYDWQAWNSQVLMSRCREEPLEERKRESIWGEGRFGGRFLGTC